MSLHDLTSIDSGGSIESNPSTAVSADTESSKPHVPGWTDADSSVKRSNETSKKSPSVLRLIDSDNPDSSETAEYAKQFASENKSPLVQERVAELLERGLNQKANDVAACSEWSGEYVCDNGHKSYTLKHCNHPTTCPICESRPGGRAKEEYGSEILSWSQKTYRCYKTDDRYAAHELGAAMDEVYKKYKDSFLNRRVRLNKRDVYKIRRHKPDIAELVEHKQRHNEPVTMGDLIDGQLVGRHITEHPDGYSVHLDVICDSWVPIDLLNRVWEKCGGKPNVQSGSIRKKKGRTYKASVLAAIAYITEKCDIEDTADRITFAEQRDGRKRYQPLGSLYGSGDLISDRKITLECPYCGDSNLTYLGPSDKVPSSREQTRVLMDGERIFGDKYNIPPPDD